MLYAIYIYIVIYTYIIYILYILYLYYTYLHVGIYWYSPIESPNVVSTSLDSTPQKRVTLGHLSSTSAKKASIAAPTLPHSKGATFAVVPLAIEVKLSSRHRFLVPTTMFQGLVYTVIESLSALSALSSS